MTIRMQANSIFLQPCPQEKQREQLAINLCCLCLSRMGLGSPTYSPVPKFVWLWRPLLLRSVPIPVCTLTNPCPSRSSKRRSHGSLSFVGRQQLLSSGRQRLSCAQVLPCSWPGERIWHPGRVIAGSRLPPLDKITCSAASLITAKERGGDQELGQMSCSLCMGLGWAPSSGQNSFCGRTSEYTRIA